MIILPGKTIGIIGGGQLGKMMVMAAAQMGYNTVVFSDQKDSPACAVASEVVIAPYSDQIAWETFKKMSDIVTYEWENVPLNFIQYLEKETLVRPGSNILSIAQNRIREKKFIRSLNIETPLYQAVTDKKSFFEAVSSIGFPCILKTSEMGYDGKGQCEINFGYDLEKIWEESENSEKILEKKIPFEKEISVIAARNSYGQFAAFVPVHNIYKDKILDISIAPADVSEEVSQKAIQITKKIMESVNYVGVMAVEFFVTYEKKVIVNEIAPRPHNSGHWTIDACYTSQFEQHIRAICNLRLGNTAFHSKAVMKNLVGSDVLNWQKFENSGKCKLHIYGKKTLNDKRKMGHLTTLL